MPRTDVSTIRFTAMQLRHLHGIFCANIPGAELGDHVTFLSRWLYYGQPGQVNNKHGGHTIWPEHWDTSGALLLYRLIVIVMRLRPSLPGASKAAYRRRLAYLESTFNLSAIEILGAHAWGVELG